MVVAVLSVVSAMRELPLNGDLPHVTPVADMQADFAGGMVRLYGLYRLCGRHVPVADGRNENNATTGRDDHRSRAGFSGYHASARSLRRSARLEVRL
jgi:hypothetical protein